MILNKTIVKDLQMTRTYKNKKSHALLLCPQLSSNCLSNFRVEIFIIFIYIV